MKFYPSYEVLPITYEVQCQLESDNGIYTHTRTVKIFPIRKVCSLCDDLDTKIYMPLIRQWFHKKMLFGILVSDLLKYFFILKSYLCHAISRNRIMLQIIPAVKGTHGSCIMFSVLITWGHFSTRLFWHEIPSSRIITLYNITRSYIENRSSIRYGIN